MVNLSLLLKIILHKECFFLLNHYFCWIIIFIHFVMKQLFISLLIIVLYTGSDSLFSQNNTEKGEINKVVLSSSSQSWDGVELPAYPSGKPKISILHITIPPKEKLALHKHPIINAGVLIKGELKVVKPNGETLILKQGEAIIELVNSEHYGVNEGDVDAEIIVFYAGDEHSPLSTH